MSEAPDVWILTVEEWIPEVRLDAEATSVQIIAVYTDPQLAIDYIHGVLREHKELAEKYPDNDNITSDYESLIDGSPWWTIYPMKLDAQVYYPWLGGPVKYDYWYGDKQYGKVSTGSTGGNEGDS